MQEKHEKQIIPVKGEKFWPSGWLSLGIAGKLYYELTDSNQAYAAHKNVPDSTPMNDFIFAVLTAHEGEQSEEEREKVCVQFTGLQYRAMCIARCQTLWGETNF